MFSFFLSFQKEPKKFTKRNKEENDLQVDIETFSTLNFPGLYYRCYLFCLLFCCHAEFCFKCPRKALSFVTIIIFILSHSDFLADFSHLD